ncbi:MAG TPA: sulfocyanin-like copper-binding protein [Candidatus Kapabacteria bacterium]|jgi:plastocyanin
MRPFFLSLSFVLVLLILSCGSSQHATNGEGYTRTTNGSTVSVLEDEYRIHIPTAFPGGVVTFHIVNDGKMKHSFKIKGNTTEQQLPNDIAPGDSADLTVNLTPGVYDIDCPVFGHAQLGMRLSVTVTQ